MKGEKIKRTVPFYRNAGRLIAILLLLLAVWGASGCGILTKPSEEEIKEAMDSLLPASFEATYMVYGPGAEPDSSEKIDPSWTTSHYIPVAASCKYRTVKQLKELIRSAFSEGYANEMYEYAFFSNDSIMSRYGESAGVLTIDVTKKPLRMATDIYTDTLKIDSGSAYACVVKVEASFDGGETREEIRIQMIKENGSWIFDGPTY